MINSLRRGEIGFLLEILVNLGASFWGIKSNVGSSILRKSEKFPTPIPEKYSWFPVLILISHSYAYSSNVTDA